MIKGYYFITDSGLSRNGNLSDVRDAVEAGACMVQYRSKDRSAGSMLREALELRKICSATAFIINDRVDIALAAGADGVHIGNDDLPYEAARALLGKDAIIGVSVHSVEEALSAESKGADYLSAGPVFPTTTKRDTFIPCGPALIKDIKKRCKAPLVAIGGITLDNVNEVIEAGAGAVCAVSAVLKSANVKKEIGKFAELL